jgi:hypothetical protein
VTVDTPGPVTPSDFALASADSEATDLAVLGPKMRSTEQVITHYERAPLIVYGRFCIATFHKEEHLYER